MLLHVLELIPIPMKPDQVVVYTCSYVDVVHFVCVCVRVLCIDTYMCTGIDALVHALIHVCVYLLCTGES